MNKYARREDENTQVQKKCTWGRKQRKAGKVQQVIDGGGVQVGACERPGRCQPNPLRINILKSKQVYVHACACMYMYACMYVELVHRVSGSVLTRKLVHPLRGRISETIFLRNLGAIQRQWRRWGDLVNRFRQDTSLF